MAAQSSPLREPQLRPDPVGEAMDRSIPLRSGPARNWNTCCISGTISSVTSNARSARELCELAAVVKQRLVSPGLNIDRRQTLS
jgi:hypothetical protein